MLKPNGIVALTTPNVNAVIFNEANGLELLKQWKHYKPKEHLFLYTKASLTLLLMWAGLVPVHWGYEESLIRPGNPNGDIITCVAQKQQ